MLEFTDVETSRLRLRRFKDTDLAAFLEYRNDPEVARYQSWEGISEAEAWAFLREQRDLQPGVPGVGMQIAIEHKESGELLGDCYFKLEAEEPRQAELGYSLARAYQGYGFASEAVTAWLSYAFRTFDLHRVIAITDCENSASVTLLERLGMRREGHFIQNIWFKGKWGDEYLYAILREEWERLHG
ncbi:ribosomal-protein-serine acetyltransferase [Dictyobacter alpinus]|uniref:Ribosomal-protein-serine acetyltransferase n=1 Tax=Dictyobacter alpinus TaxID=2014873 RepID=A0A402BBY5_9CHLR|nr:GNAT family protein [Dictyobacter alpinus]GCE28787.1 ribosomal-protein-serine acetyltransferase [Dictyobacter alpinus]